jgi:hypothetical protein
MLTHAAELEEQAQELERQAANEPTDPKERP